MGKSFKKYNNKNKELSLFLIEKRLEFKLNSQNFIIQSQKWDDSKEERPNEIKF